jgi:hypothetical protein
MTFNMENHMKNVLVALGIVALLGATAGASTIVLPAGDIKVKFENLEQLYGGSDVNDRESGFWLLEDEIYVSDSSGLAVHSWAAGVIADEDKDDAFYLGDNFGTFRVTRVTVENGGSTANPHEDGADYTVAGTELTGMFWGLDVFAEVLTPGIVSTRFADGGYLDVYQENGVSDVIVGGGSTELVDDTRWSRLAANTNTAFVPSDFTVGADGRLKFVTATEGTHLVAMEFASGKSTVFPTATLVGAFSPTTFPSSGTGLGFLDVQGGPFASLPWAWQLDTNSQGGALGRDLDLANGYSLQSPPLKGWLLDSNDPLEGESIPEPGTMALLGLGLAGVGGVVYRRRRSKN